MARVTGVIFEIVSQGRPGAFSVPKAAADPLTLKPGDDVELRVNWGGRQIELHTQLRSGLEIYHRSNDPLTRDLADIPPRTPLTVTVWRAERLVDDGSAEPSREKGWWAEDGGSDFEQRIDADDVEARRLYNWARDLMAEGLVRLHSYHNSEETTFTLLPYLKQHNAGLVTIWGDGRLSLFRSVFERFAPASIPPVEKLMGKPLGQGTAVTGAGDDLLRELRDAYAAAAALGSGREWTDERFDATFKNAVGSVALLNRLREWAGSNGVTLRYGKGKTSGPMHFDVTVSGGTVVLVSVSAIGGIEWVFRDNLDRVPAFKDRGARLDLLRDACTVFGVERRDDRAETWMSFDLHSLDESGHEGLTGLLDRQLALVRGQA